MIGGPPCQFASEMSRLNAAMGKKPAANLIPEFERIVAAAQCAWFAMENVVAAPAPAIAGYEITQSIVRDHWCGGETMRKRRISIGTLDGRRVHVTGAALQRQDPELAITSCSRAGHVRVVISGKERKCSTRGPRMPIAEMARLQGLPDAFFGSSSPFTVEAQRKMIGNGVPLAMGRAIASAIVRSFYSSIEEAAA